MTSQLRRHSRKAESLFFAFLVAGVSACSGGPSQSKLSGIATSDEVRQKRERTERELRARASEIGASSPWGPALRTTLVDTCTRGGGKNLLDPNPPKQPLMICGIRMHLYFVVDRPVTHVLQDLRSMRTPTVWNGDSINGALRYYDDRTYEKPHAYQPSIASASGGERLAWDAPGDNAKVKTPEPCPGPKAVFRTCTSDPPDLPLDALRERGGTLFEWTVYVGYHTVLGT